MGATTSDRWRSGAMIISIAVMKATKPPTVPPVLPLCQSAITITVDKAQAASTCVSGVMAPDEATTFIMMRRRRSPWPVKRSACAASAPCRRTMRQASTFSSTT